MKREQIVQLILNRLSEERDAVASQWNNPVETSTRHFIVDNLLPAEVATAIYEAFPRDGDGFFSKATFREKKRTSSNLSEYPAILEEITYALQDAEVVAKVAEICEFKALEPDPALYAGGLSMMFKDDYLNPHIDNSHDGKRDRYRRLNLLYYASPDWALEYGGNFELWDDGRTRPKTIVAHQNRLVVMETNKTSWHSVSRVVADRPRCCVSNYYFSKESPDQSEYFHVTSFDGRPEEPVKRVVGVIDNALRNVVSRTLGMGRGKDEINPKR
jgi:Rps23 Pro-64 3,4-dihydroxylase Tpa1-like proline 4-hydroxylase